MIKFKIDYFVDKYKSSYLEDNDVFNEDKIYKLRNSNFEEYNYLRQLFFPKQFEVDIDKDLENIILGFKNILEKNSNLDDLSLNYNKLFEKILINREILKKDVKAAYIGDPSANSYREIIRNFPGFQSIMIHRFSHELYNLGFKNYSREISELGHQLTGIDIHPGAKIKPGFFIDHGTGVVIGETTEIGENVRIYHQVTLGAFNFKKDVHGNLEKNYKRHPTIGDNVIIGTSCKILGAISIGNNVNIGVNSLITTDIKDNTTVYSENNCLVYKFKN